MENNWEKISRTLAPVRIKIMILLGVVMCLLGITIFIYNYLKKKQKREEIKVDLFYSLLLGIATILSGFMIKFFLNLEIDFSSFKL